MPAVSSYSLFPLLFHHKEYPLKITITVLYLLGIKCGSSHLFQSHSINSDDSQSVADGCEGEGSGGEKDGIARRDGGGWDRLGGREVGNGRRTVAELDDRNMRQKSVAEMGGKNEREQGGLQFEVPENDCVESQDFSKDREEEREESNAHAAIVIFSTRERLENVYIWGLVLLEIFVRVVHPLVLGKKLPFLPLMAISVYSAVGMVYVWISLLVIILSDSKSKVN